MSNGTNMGSFGLGMPGFNDPIKQAIQARQQGGQPVPTMSQRSPQGARGISQGIPVTSIQRQMPQAGQDGQSPLVPEEEKVLIVKALTDRLKMIGSIEKIQAGGQPPQWALCPFYRGRITNKESSCMKLNRSRLKRNLESLENTGLIGQVGLFAKRALV